MSAGRRAGACVNGLVGGQVDGATALPDDPAFWPALFAEAHVEGAEARIVVSLAGVFCTCLLQVVLELLQLDSITQPILLVETKCTSLVVGTVKNIITISTSLIWKLWFGKSPSVLVQLQLQDKVMPQS